MAILSMADISVHDIDPYWNNPRAPVTLNNLMGEIAITIRLKIVCLCYLLKVFKMTFFLTARAKIMRYYYQIRKNLCLVKLAT